MKKILIIFVLTAIFYPMIMEEVGMAEALTNGSNRLKISINATDLGKDINWNAKTVLIDITINRLGHLLYMEEYYSVDSNSQPKFYSSQRYFEGDLTSNTISFQILRPKKSTKTFILTKSIIFLDNERVLEKWQTKNITDYIIIDPVDINASKANDTNKSIKIANNITKANKSNKIIYNEIKSMTPVDLNYTTVPQKSNGFEMVITIIVILLIYGLNKWR